MNQAYLFEMAFRNNRVYSLNIPCWFVEDFQISGADRIPESDPCRF